MNKDDLCHAAVSASGETSSASPLQSGFGAWLPGETLPERQPNSYFPVYLAFSDGKVEMADWAGYETTGSEYHSNGTYLGEYTQDGDSFYMTETGHQVFPSDEGGPWTMEALDDDDKRIKISVVAWMEALKPVPTYPQAGLKSEATPSAQHDAADHDTKSKLEEAKEIIRESLTLMELLSDELFPEMAAMIEDFGTKEQADRIRAASPKITADLPTRARSFLKENSNG